MSGDDQVAESLEQMLTTTTVLRSGLNLLESQHREGLNRELVGLRYWIGQAQGSLPDEDYTAISGRLQDILATAGRALVHVNMLAANREVRGLLPDDQIDVSAEFVLAAAEHGCTVDFHVYHRLVADGHPQMVQYTAATAFHASGQRGDAYRGEQASRALRDQRTELIELGVWKVK